MAEKYARYYQKCDFCHRTIDVSSGGMESITLPGCYLSSAGTWSAEWVTADICHECKERLREYLAKTVDIKEIAYNGVDIHWLDEREREKEKNHG